MSLYSTPNNVVNVPGGQMILPPASYVAEVILALLEQGNVTVLPVAGGGFEISLS